ncbi:MAG TPA: DEAD/DEAH box helicase [Gemmatimonadales bacterium]|nr:DEAD/DEAH box helicase [Gemmatimonadales bacterium]
MPFSALGLMPELVRAVAEEGYERPTPIQQETIPLALEGRDLIGSAQTGTGKTAAFMLPILQRLAKTGKTGATRALVLVPTRELAEQVATSARAYGRHLMVTAAAVYGGVGMEPQTKALTRGVDVVVATPGRLLDHMERGHVNFSRLEVLVLDEADRMLDMGFAPDVNRILRGLPVERQTMLFSATISREVDALARKALNGHASVEIGRRAQTAEGIEHVIVAVDKAKKKDVLVAILQAKPEGQTLVFTRTKYGADKLVTHLKKSGIPAHALHGDKAQSHRQRTLDEFRDGRTEILVATDIAARGIDVDGIRMVVNFDVPNDPEAYVHRVGRTARAGAQGLGLTLISPDEWLMMADVEKLIGRSFPREVIPGFEPSVPPLQPKPMKEVAAKPARSVGMRTGGRRRR